jgi:hypothetical protein
MKEHPANWRILPGPGSEQILCYRPGARLNLGACQPCCIRHATGWRVQLEGDWKEI